MKTAKIAVSLAALLAAHARGNRRRIDRCGATGGRPSIERQPPSQSPLMSGLTLDARGLGVLTADVADLRRLDPSLRLVAV